MLNKIDPQQVQLDTSEPIGHQQTSSSVIKMPTFQAGGAVVKGLMRNPEDGELAYFKNNPNVTGMATDDNRVILNPYSKLTDKEKELVALNEAARVKMRTDANLAPNFDLTPAQTEFLNSNTYKQASDQDRKATIAARILSGDPSAGTPTEEQTQFVDRLRQSFSETEEPTKLVKGGQVRSQTQRMLKEGGMLQEGGTVDPVSGNKVPVGAMKEEVRDDVPAQLSEGEFVFPADVVRYIGLERLMQMRQAAKKGLMQMEDMGQMSNGEEGSEEEDTAEFESELDDIMSEMEGEDRKMAIGGDVMPMEQAPVEQLAAPAMQQTPEAIPTGEPTLTPEQMSKIQETAKNMQNRKIDIDQSLISPPTEGVTSSDIILSNLTDAGYKGNPEVFLRALTIRSKQKKVAVARFSDTVFVGVPVDNETMTVHLFSKDPPQKVQDSIKAGIQTLQNAGIKRIQSQTTNVSLLNMLKKLPYQTSVEEDNGSYNLSMEIGK